MKKSLRTEATARIHERYLLVKDSLTERGRRLFAASEAKAFGYGGIVAATEATKMAPSAIGRGLREISEIESGSAPPLDPQRSRQPGGGRKKITEKFPTLLPDLNALLESTRGDPESPLLWTARSQRNLVAALIAKGHKVSMKTLARLLKDLARFPAKFKIL